MAAASTNSPPNVALWRQLMPLWQASSVRRRLPRGEDCMPKPVQIAGSSARKTRQREELALALMQQPSLEKAAESIGISRVTAWRISKTAEFQQEYRQARRAAMS